MPYYHVRITQRGEKHDEVKLDLDLDQLESKILAPYRSGAPITINGKSMPAEQVERVRISMSDTAGGVLADAVRARDLQSTVVMVGGPSTDWRAAASAEDVTDEFITGPPGVPAPQPGQPPGRRSTHMSEPHSVFVIAGRDTAVSSAVIAFLRALGLKVIEWEHAVAATGRPSPYTGDVVRAGLNMAGGALVLLTPDDEARLRQDLLRDEDGPAEREFSGQARPNVLYEAGFADGLAIERTVIVEVGRLRKPFTDVAGRHVVRYDGSAAKRNTLVARLRVAGLLPDTQGSDWLSAGPLPPLE